MKTSKLLAVLALAGFCGTAEAQARAHRFEVKELERERGERLEVCREAKERLRELSRNEGRDEEVVAESESENLKFGETVGLGGSLGFNWEVGSCDLAAERELEEERLREAAREIERIDRVIGKVGRI